MSRGVTYSPVLTGISQSSGKHLRNRTAMYTLCLFPNVTPWRLRSCRGAGSPQESVP